MNKEFFAHNKGDGHRVHVAELTKLLFLKYGSLQVAPRAPHFKYVAESLAIEQKI